MFHPFKSITLVFAFLILLGCSDNDNDAPQSIIEVIQAQESASTFLNLIENSTSQDLLSSARVLAVPSNQAFSDFLSILGSNELPLELTQQLLAFHVEESPLEAGQNNQSPNRAWQYSSTGIPTRINDANVSNAQTIIVDGSEVTVAFIDKVLIPNRARFEYDGSAFESNAGEQLQTAEDLLTAASFMSSLRPLSSDGSMRGLTQPELISVLEPAREKLRPAFNAVIAALIPELVAAANGGSYHPDSSAVYNGEGGGYTLTGSRRYLYDENGLEPQQIIEKGMYMALLYNQMLEVTSTLEEGDADRLLALLGANPRFRNSNRGEYADRLGANYIARRDQNQGNGLYFENTDALRSLRIALSADAPIAAQQAADAFLIAYERGIAATIINYLHQANASISLSNPTDDDLSAALHAYAEAIGFSLGFIGLDTFITDDQMAEIINLMRYNDGPNSEVFRLVTERFDSMERNNQIIDRFQQVYGFSDQEIDSFRFNWVNEQGR